MELSKNTLELMRVLEGNFGVPSYTFIPKLIREEIKSFTIKPTPHHDENGNLLEIKFELDVEWNKENAITKKAS